MQTNNARVETCFACGHHVAVQFLHDEMPLATIAWPASVAEAEAMTRLPLDFVRCVACGHVYNPAFDYEMVPYSKRPNLMFNKGSNWSDFLMSVASMLKAELPRKGTVVEIGHGDGTFLRLLRSLLQDAELIGFDPNAYGGQNDSIEYRAEMFVADEHLPTLRPDLIITRHVLEHLHNPLGFLQALAFAANVHAVFPMIYIEVPCIDKVLTTRRTVDFYYEHSSHFTTRSFEAMVRCCGMQIEKIGHGYGGEVIYGLLTIQVADEQLTHALEAFDYLRETEVSRESITATIEGFRQDAKSIAIWGGTGKSAAFINRYGLDREQFPTVVDSDPEKVGTFVPGTGQEILPSSYLTDNACDILIVPTQWRVRDILDEIADLGISYERLLIEHGGALIDFEKGGHSY